MNPTQSGSGRLDKRPPRAVNIRSAEGWLPTTPAGGRRVDLDAARDQAARFLLHYLGKGEAATKDGLGTPPHGKR